MRTEVWHLSPEMLAETEIALRRGRHEVFVIWAGPRDQDPSGCALTRLIVPKQTPESNYSGVSVLIDGSELARVQFANFDRCERSYVQIHTHPKRNVEMSRLDRKREVVSHIGALSIIVPDYGDSGLKGFPGVNVYEREERGWRLWTPQESGRIRVS